MDIMAPSMPITSSAGEHIEIAINKSVSNSVLSFFESFKNETLDEVKYECYVFFVLTKSLKICYSTTTLCFPT